MQERPPFSADSRVVIYGPDWKKIGQMQYVISVIRISGEWMVLMAGNIMRMN